MEFGVTMLQGYRIVSLLLILIFHLSKKPAGQTYSVVAGDSLSKIALKFDTTINEIKELNHLSSDMIFVGQTLLIPTDEPSVETEPINVSTDQMAEEMDAPVEKGDDVVHEPSSPTQKNVEETTARESISFVDTKAEVKLMLYQLEIRYLLLQKV